MAGYTIVERGALSLSRETGIPAHAEELGFLDFLRELAADELPFPKFAELRLVGLEEVLFAARPGEGELALDFHRRLRLAAPELERRLISVQVVFQGTLVRGDTLWVEYRGQKLPVANIFGSPPPQTDARGNRSYHSNFNLTHA
jgi:hypothetical protein